MRYGIAISDTDQGTLTPDFIVEANLAALPLSVLAYELQSYTEIAENLGLEKIRLITLRHDDGLFPTLTKIGGILKRDKPSRLYFHPIGDAVSVTKFMDLLAASMEQIERVGFISPIGELYKEKSFTRDIITKNTRRIEYVPMMSYFPNIPIPTLEMIRQNNGRDLTILIQPLEKNPEYILKWIEEKLAPNGVDTILYPSLFYAHREMFPEETDMVTKRKYTPRKKKVVVVEPDEPKDTGTVKVVMLYPTAKRYTASLNSTVVGTCEIGEKFELVNKITITPELIFGETKQGFFICLRANKIDYVEFQ